MNRPITPPPSCSPCSSGPSSPASLCLSLSNDRNDHLLPVNGIDSSYEDVMSLIQEAKAVSDSIDHSLQDMKLQFFELGDSWKSGEADQPAHDEADCSLVVKKKTVKKDKKKVKKDKKDKPKKSQPLKKTPQEPAASAPVVQQKKRVRFASPTELCQVEYIDIPSMDCQEMLSFTAEEQQDMIVQLQQDVDDYEDGRPDFYYECGCPSEEDHCREHEEYTSRGLEQRTTDGQEIRIEWRTSVRDSVLDEQERQWLELPPSEPCDVYDIAQVSLVCSRESKEFARQLALQDESDVYGLVEYDEDDEEAEQDNDECQKEEDDTATVVTALSETSWSTIGTTQTNNASTTRVNRLSWSLSSLLEEEAEAEDHVGVNDDDEGSYQEEEDATKLGRRLTRSLVASASEATAAGHTNLNLNSKGHSVHWPDAVLSSPLEQVYSYDLPLAQLSEDEEEENDDSSASPSSSDDRLYPAEEKARFHFATPQEEEQYQQVRLQMFLQLYDPCHQNNPIELAKKCSEISAPARRLARQRATTTNNDDHDKLEEQPREEKPKATETTTTTTITTAPTTTTRRGGLASRLTSHPSICDTSDSNRDAASGDNEDLDGYLRALYSEEEELLHSYHKENSMTWDI